MGPNLGVAMRSPSQAREEDSRGVVDGHDAVGHSLSRSRRMKVRTACNGCSHRFCCALRPASEAALLTYSSK